MDRLKKYIRISILIAIIFYVSVSIENNFYLNKKNNFRDEELYKTCEEKGIYINEGDKNDSVNVKDIKNMMKNIYEGPLKDEKIVFLTFDDGPSANTEKILETLKENEVNATFFILGKGLENEKNKERLKEIYEYGNSIGNHGYSHNSAKIYPNNKVDVEVFIDELKKTEEAIKGVLGVYKESEGILVRMPGGYGSRKHYKDPNLETLNKRFIEENIDNIDWNCLNGDGERKKYSKKEMLQYVKRTSKGKKHVVVLMHDGKSKKNTVEILPDIIDYFKEEGYSFKKIVN